MLCCNWTEHFFLFHTFMSSKSCHQLVTRGQHFPLVILNTAQVIENQTKKPIQTACLKLFCEKLIFCCFTTVETFFRKPSTADVLSSPAHHHFLTMSMCQSCNRHLELLVQASHHGSHVWARLLDSTTGSAPWYGKRAAGRRDQEERLCHTRRTDLFPLRLHNTQG